MHGRGAEGDCFVNSDRLEAFELSFMNPYKEFLKSVGGKVKFGNETKSNLHRSLVGVGSIRHRESVHFLGALSAVTVPFAQS